MRIAEYLTTEEMSVAVGGKQSKMLPAGSFVKPIEFHYLPKHIKENSDGIHYNPKTQVFCYTHYGIVLIQREKLRKV